MTKGLLPRHGFRHVFDNDKGQNFNWFTLRGDKETILGLGKFIKTQGWVTTKKHNVFDEDGIRFSAHEYDGDDHWVAEVWFENQSTKAATFKLFFAPAR